MVMASQIREQYPYAQILFGMANTGKETEPTMRFAQKGDEYFKLGLTLVEAVVHPDKESGHKVVSFSEASMNGTPMEAVIRKYGVPTLGHMHCTRETKTNPLKSWLKEKGWTPGTYRIALGIRADETDRINPEARSSNRFIYPLAERGLQLHDIEAIAATWPFRLEQPPHEGNCKDCHKKSVLKTVINLKNHPDWLDQAAEFDRLYGRGRKRYRGGRTAAEMIELARTTETADPRVLSNEEHHGCATDCNPWSEEVS